MITRLATWISGLLFARTRRGLPHAGPRSSPEDAIPLVLRWITGVLLAAAVLMPGTITPLLWITGLLAAAAMVIPLLLTLGMMLIFPGLVLAAMPTTFVYLSTFAIVRQLLPWSPGFATDASAMALTIALGIAVTVPSQLLTRLAVESARKEEVTPEAPIRLSGHVTLEHEPAATRRTAAGELVGECDALCAALLETPGVEAVTVAGSSSTGQAVRPVTYRLVRTRDESTTGVAPYRPEDIIQNFPQAKARCDAIRASWALRLAGEERLVAEPAGGDPDHRITIFSGRPGGIGRISVQELSVLDRAGRVLLRTQHMVARPLMVPFSFMLEDGKREIEFRIGVGRTRLDTGPRFYKFEPVETLFKHTSLVRPGGRPAGRAAGRAGVQPEGLPEGVEAIRERLAAALLDRSLPASDRAFGLAGTWLDMLDRKRVEPRDREVLAMAVADPRVTNLKRLFRWALPELRDAVTARLSLPGNPETIISELDGLLRNMPPGTYAQQTAAERALVQDRGLRLKVPALVERLADQGAAGVPLLLDVLTGDVAVEPWKKRYRVLLAVRKALILLGPAAAPALPTLEALLGTGRLEFTGDDVAAWRLAQVRMGKPLDEVSFPDYFDAVLVARAREDIRGRLKRFSEGGLLYWQY